MTVDLFMVWNSVFVAWYIYPKKEQTVTDNSCVLLQNVTQKLGAMQIIYY